MSGANPFGTRPLVLAQDILGEVASVRGLVNPFGTRPLVQAQDIPGEVASVRGLDFY